MSAALALATATLHLVDNPFRDRGRSTLEVRAGESIAQTLSDHWPPHWPEDPIPHLAVAVNGRVVDDLWQEIAPGDVVSVMPAHADPVTIGSIILMATPVTAAATLFTGFVGALALAGVAYGVNRLLAPSLPSLRQGESSAGSNVWRWDGAQTQFRSLGAPVPVIYGEHVTGGHVISYFIRSRRNRAGNVKGELWMALALSESEIEAIGGVDRELNDATGADIPPDIWLNGTRARDIPGVRVSTRLGTLHQTAVPGFNDRVRRVAHVRKLVKGGGAYSFTTRGPVNRVEFGIRFPKGLVKVDSETGDTLWSEPIKFRWRHKVVGGTAGWSNWIDFRIRNRAPGDFTLYVEGELPSRSRYSIEIERTTPRIAGISTPNASQLEAVNEIQDRGFRHPGLAYMTLVITASEVLNGGRPSVEVLVRGRRVRIWSGSSWSRSWTRCPFWVTYDILTNTDYSFGDELRHATYDLEEWEDGSDHAAELVPADVETTLSQAVGVGASYLRVGDTAGWSAGDTARIAADAAGEEDAVVVEVTDDGRLRLQTQITGAHAIGTTVAKYHARYEFDAVFDGQRSPWEQAQSVLATARAQLVKVGNLITLKRSIDRTPTLLLSEGNLERDSLEVTRLMPRLQQPNALNVQFLDRAKRFEMNPVPVTAADAVIDKASDSTYYQREAYRPRDEAAFGITRIEQARRHGAFRLRQLRLPKWAVKGVSTLEALQVGVGSVVNVAHPTILPTVSGVVIATVSSGGSTVQVDRSLALEAGVTYGIEVRVGDSTWVQRTITSPAGSYDVGDTISISGTWPADVKQNAPYALGPEDQVVLPFELNVFEEVENSRIRFEGLEHVPEVHAD